jgi:hypothetical protein
MPDYRLTLTLRDPNKDKTIPHQRAQEKADNRGVTVRGRSEHANGTVTWDVTGTPDQVCKMIGDWKIHNNLTHVTSEPTFDCPDLG